MNSIDGIVEKYLKYSDVYNPILNNYINMYGKDALYMILPENANNLDTDDIYIKALGKQRVSFDYSSNLIKKINAKILVEYSEWFKSYTGDSVDILIYFSTEVHDQLNTGDVILHEKDGIQYFYRVTEPVETYAKRMFRMQLKLIQKKEVKIESSERGLLI